jgi:hypothetical protein
MCCFLLSGESSSGLKSAIKVWLSLSGLEIFSRIYTCHFRKLYNSAKNSVKNISAAQKK